ncbi:MAG: hypothetical protein NY202_03290 [Mollicutes bacterium UO1]
MDNTIELLLEQLKQTNESVRQCQTYLTVALVVCVIAIVLILFIIFKGKGKFTRDEIIIGDVKDTEKLHKEVERLNGVVEKLEQKANQQK